MLLKGKSHFDDGNLTASEKKVAVMAVQGELTCVCKQHLIEYYCIFIKFGTYVIRYYVDSVQYHLFNLNRQTRKDRTLYDEKKCIKKTDQTP